MTNKLDNSELQDKYFMMRVRFDGGRVTPEQLRVVGGVSRDFGRGTADFTDRQNIQIHWIEIENVPEIWERLDAVGLSTLLGCGDVPRVIVGSPVAGVAAEEIIDATPAIERIKNEYLLDPEFHNLPRKFKSAISGNSCQDITHEIQDLAFVGGNHPEYGPGFDVWVGGGLSTNPMIARRLGVWVPLDEVLEVWANTVRIFRDFGYRRLRNRARLKFLIASWGIERFRAVLEEYMGHPFVEGVEPPIVTGNRDHIGVHAQKDGRFYVGVKPTVGHASGEQLIAIADAATRFGVTRIRTTPSKELLFLDVEEHDVAPLTTALEELGLYLRPSEFRRGFLRRGISSHQVILPGCNSGDLDGAGTQRHVAFLPQTSTPPYRPTWPSFCGFPDRAGDRRGLIDSTGGGGWGPVTSSTMLALGRHDPRRIVGTVNAAEFLVTASATIGFAVGMWDAIITYWPLILTLLIGVLIAAPIAAWALSRFNPTFLGVLVGALLVSLNLPRVFGLYTLWPLQAAIVVLGLVLGGRCNRYERAHRTARSAHPVSRKVQEPKSLVIPVS